MTHRLCRRTDGSCRSLRKGPRSWLACLALGCSAFAPNDAAAAEEAAPEQQFHLALEAQSAREYDLMLSLLRKAAAADHVQAQELLGLALLVGPAFYGTAVPQDRCEAGLWMRRAATQGSGIARYHLTFINRLRHAPMGQDACAPVR